MTMKNRLSPRARRHRRVRSRVSGTKDRPRLSVFRSKQHLFAQLVDDKAARTLLAVHDLHLPKVQKVAKTHAVSAGVARAEALGRLLGEKAKVAGITHVVFDRGGYLYHGRVRALADGARAAGLKF